MSERIKRMERPKTIHVLVPVFIINVAAFLQGASVSSSSVILGQLEKVNSSIELFLQNSTDSQNVFEEENFEEILIDNEQATWIASSWMIGHLISSLMAGFISDLLGRRTSLLLDILVFFVGFGLLSFGRTYPLLVFGRFLLGYPLVTQVYACEILSSERRGPYSAVYAAMHSLGFVLQLVLGAYVNWRMSLLIPMVLCIPAFIGVFCIHESPEWLLKKKKMAVCLASADFYNLHGFLELVELEKQKIKHCDKVDEKSKMDDNLLMKFRRNLKSAVVQMKGDVLLKVSLLSILFLLQGWCGFVILGSYAVDIFTRSGSPFEPQHTSWITSLVKVPAAIASFFIIARFPRKSLFVVLSLVISFSFALVGSYTYLNSFPDICPILMEKLVVIPMLMIITAYAAYGCGFNTLPQLLTAEIIPVTIRSSVVGFVTTLEMASTFTLSKLKSELIETIGLPGLFFMFSGVVFSVMMMGVITFNTSSKARPEEENASRDNNTTPI